MRLAIAHDALVYAGGAERVVAALLTRWPTAPVYTSAYLPESTFSAFRHADVRTSFLQRFATSPHTVMRRVFPLMVPAFRLFDFSGCDVVLSSAAYAAKAIRVPSTTCHICYCYSPLRIAWRPDDYLTPASSRVTRLGLHAAASVLRRWDLADSRHVDVFVTTCRNVAERIKVAYRRDAVVVHAPIEFARYRVRPTGDYYLVVSRLNHYKRIDLAIEAATRLRRRLVVVGVGPLRVDLEKRADPTWVTFRGQVTDEELLDLYAGCRALIFPQEEDYGLTPLEAQASGRPVIAYAAGGALETIRSGETGTFFATQDCEAVMAAILENERQTFDPDRIRQHAAGFDVSIFCDRMELLVEQSWRAFTEKAGRSEPAQ